MKTTIITLVTIFLFFFGFLQKAAASGLQLSLDQDTFMKIGYRLQVWGQFAENQAPSGNNYQKDFLFRRNRIWVQGQINDWIKFFYQTDERAGGLRDDKSLSGGLETRDAWITLDFASYFKFQTGIFKIPFSRARNESGFAQLALDFPFVETKTMSANRIGGKRDRGIALWGNLADGRFHYRMALLDGKESLDGKDNPRYSARIHLSVLEPEKGWGYKGTYPGTKKTLSFGAGYDFQSKTTGTPADMGDYSAWTIDGFFEYPLSPGNPTLEGAWFSYDTKDKNLTNQGDGWYLQGGWLLSKQINSCRLQPFARLENWNSDNNSPGIDQTRWSLGLNSYFQERTKLTLSWTRVLFDKEDAENPSSKNHSIIVAQLQIML